MAHHRPAHGGLAPGATHGPDLAKRVELCVRVLLPEARLEVVVPGTDREAPQLALKAARAHVGVFGEDLSERKALNARTGAVDARPQRGRGTVGGPARSERVDVVVAGDLALEPGAVARARHHGAVRAATGVPLRKGDTRYLAQERALYAQAPGAHRCD